MAVIQMAIEKRVVRGPPAGRHGLGDEAEMLVDECRDGVEVVHRARLGEVGNSAGIMPLSTLAGDLSLERHGHQQRGDLPGPAKLLDRVDPVFALGKVAAPGQDRGGFAEVVGADADHNEVGAEAVEILHQGVIILLGRVADVAGVEDRDRGAPRLAEGPSEALRRGLVVGHEEPLHERVAEDKHPDRRARVGLGSSAAPGIGGLQGLGQDLLPRLGQGLADFGGVGQVEEAGEPVRQRVFEGPEGLRIRTHPVGSPGVVGLEDPRREHHGPVVIGPSQQDVLRRHLRGLEDAPPLGRGLPIKVVPIRRGRPLDPLGAPEPPLGINPLPVVRGAAQPLECGNGAVRQAEDRVPADGRPGDRDDQAGGRQHHDRRLEQAIQPPRALHRREQALSQAGPPPRSSGASRHRRRIEGVRAIGRGSREHRGAASDVSWVAAVTSARRPTSWPVGRTSRRNTWRRPPWPWRSPRRVSPD